MYVSALIFTLADKTGTQPKLLHNFVLFVSTSLLDGLQGFKFFPTTFSKILNSFYESHMNTLLKLNLGGGFGW